MQLSAASVHQLDTLRLYGTLVGERDNWGGGLVLCCGEGCAASGIPAAVSIASGATLAIDADAGAMKLAMRSGEIDFVVNTLDEALRALKNEVRQHRPLSVGLIADVASALGEIVERGVLPDLLLIGTGQSAQPILQDKSIRALEVAGMHLRLPGSLEDERGIRPMMILSGKGHDEVYLPASSAVELRVADERVLAMLPTDDLVRRRWIQQVPKYLRDARSGGRWVWLSEAERQQLGV
jgi:urocanate hydratase